MANYYAIFILRRPGYFVSDSLGAKLCIRPNNVSTFTELVMKMQNFSMGWTHVKSFRNSEAN